MANGNGGPPSPRPGGPGAKPPMKKSTRNWMLIGGIGAAGIVIWYIMRAKSQQSSTAATAASSGIDPATGIPYAEEYAGYGGYGVAGGGVPQQFGYYDPTTGSYITGTAAGANVIGPGTNASWAQQVESYLQGIGYDPTAVAAAIGKYLTGQTLSSDQAAIVAAAQGFYGNPPQGAPPISQGTPTGNGTGGGSSGNKPMGFITAPGKERLKAIVAKYGLTWQQAIALNPNLQRYSGKNIPKGTKINL